MHGSDNKAPGILNTTRKVQDISVVEASALNAIAVMDVGSLILTNMDHAHLLLGFRACPVEPRGNLKGSACASLSWLFLGWLTSH